MRKLLFILALLPQIIFSQVVINLSPDSTLHDLHILPPSSDTTIFYVKNGGDNSKDGLSDANAWETISKVNSETFDPGDQILFNKGDEWRETLTVPSSGSSGKNITFDAYGSGVLPKILGSVADSTWTDNGNDVWRVGTYNDPTAYGGFPGQVYFVDSDGTVHWGRVESSNITDIDTLYDWYWQNDSIYVYSTTDPGTAWATVEINQRQNGVYLNNKDYLTFTNLDIRYTALGGIKDVSTNTGQTDLLIDGVNVSFVGVKNGAAAFGIAASYSNFEVKNCTIHDVGRRFVTINANGTGHSLSNVDWHDNFMYDSYHSGMDVFIPGTGTLTDIDIYNNTMVQDTAIEIDGVEGYIMAGVFVADQATGTIDDVDIYNNVFINLSDPAIGVQTVLNPRIFNNTVFGINPSATAAASQISLTGVTTNAVVKNNIMYGTVNNDDLNSYPGLLYTSDVDVDTIDYNYYYQEDSDAIIIKKTGTGADTWLMSEFAAFNSTTGYEDNGLTTNDPYLNDPDSNDVRLVALSPAIGVGQTLGYYTVDFLGTAVTDPPNMGAYNDTLIPPDLLTVNFEVAFSSDDTALVTAIGFDATADTFRLTQIGGLNYPTTKDSDSLVLASSDTTAFQNLKVKLWAGAGNYAFALWSGFVTDNIWQKVPDNDTVNIAGDYVSEFQDVYNLMDTKPGNDTADVLNTFVETLVDNGWWDSLDIIMPMILKYGSGNEALINWKGATETASEIGAIAHTQYAGYKGNASSTAINTGWDALNDGSNYTQNEATFMWYIQDQGDTDAQWMGGARNGAGTFNIAWSDNWFGVMRSHINSAGYHQATGRTDERGMGAIVRTASNATEFVFNGASVNTDTDASTTMSDEDIYIHAVNLGSGGGGGFWTSWTQSFFAAGFLSAEGVAGVTTAWEIVMDYLGTGVIP